MNKKDLLKIGRIKNFIDGKIGEEVDPKRVCEKRLKNR